MKKIIIILFITACTTCGCAANLSNTDSVKEPNVLDKLNEKVNSLKNLTCRIDYTHTQPLFETSTTKKAKLYYHKNPDIAGLRINFTTLKQDQLDEQKYKQDYIFDGTYLAVIDYQNKSLTVEQLAPEGKPIEPFELVARYFPIVGFTDTQKLSEEFIITMPCDANRSDRKNTTVVLQPRENSQYSGIYKSVKFVVDMKLFLPCTFYAETQDNEIITINLSEINTEKKPDKSIFDIKIPAGFTETKIPLK